MSEPLFKPGTEVFFHAQVFIVLDTYDGCVVMSDEHNTIVAISEQTLLAHQPPEKTS